MRGLACATALRRARDRRAPRRHPRRRRRPLPRPRRLPGLPRPARLASRQRRLAPQPGRLEPGHLQGAASTRARPPTIAYINAHGGDHLHPDFGSPRAYGFPYAVVGAGQRQAARSTTPPTATRATPGRSRSPSGAPVEGGNGSDGDRHVLVVDRSSCTLYELYRAFFKPRPRPLERRLGRRAGTCARPRCAPTAGPRPTPPACRSSPASSATTRSPPASSTTRSASPSRAPATPGSTPPRTAPATPPAPSAPPMGTAAAAQGRLRPRRLQRPRAGRSPKR